MKAENKMLKFSAFGGLFFAILGIEWGWTIKSEMIKFDGLYSLISLILALFAIIATNFINKKDINKYPFGKCNLEPIIVISKSIILLIMFKNYPEGRLYLWQSKQLYRYFFHCTFYYHWSYYWEGNRSCQSR